MDTTITQLVGCSIRTNSQHYREGEHDMNKFAHYFLVGFAIAILTLVAAIALSNRLDAQASENALSASETVSVGTSTVR
jgi:hypothetical protein